MKEFIEKLIGRLEELGWVYADYYPDETAIHKQRKKSVAYDEVVKIVKQLAEEYNNDFCEWFKFDYRTIAPKYHDAENPYWRIPENLDKLKYCPYCGKKIKIAPYQPKGE